MKLAEALQERKDLNTKIQQLKTRIQNSIMVQEGEKPIEEPSELIAQLDSSVERLSQLIERINITNSNSKIESEPIVRLLSRRDTLKLKINVYRAFLDEASQISMRVSGSEIKLLPSIDVRKYQKILDDFSKELRLVDNTIQKANWMIDLI